MNYTIPMFAAEAAGMSGLSLFMCSLAITLLFLGIIIAFFFPFLIPGCQDGLILSKGHRKVLGLLKRFVAWRGSLLPNYVEYSGISVRDGDLFTKRYRKVLGERIYIGEYRILSSVLTDRKGAILDFLDQAMEETKCKTPEELSLFLESAGF